MNGVATEVLKACYCSRVLDAMRLACFAVLTLCIKYCGWKDGSSGTASLSLRLLRRFVGVAFLRRFLLKLDDVTFSTAWEIGAASQLCESMTQIRQIKFVVWCSHTA